MVTFNTRFAEYTTDMLIDATMSKQVLGISDKTFYAYQGRQTVKRTPTFKGLLAMAGTFGVTSDWLSGDASYPKWRDEVFRLRRWLLSRATTASESLIEQERIIFIVGLITERLPQAQQPWFMPGVLGISQERYSELMACEGEISLPMVERLSAFSGLPRHWFRLGEPESLERMTKGELDPAWVAVMDQYIAYGHEPEDHLMFGPAIDDLVQHQKRITSI